ALGGFRTQVGFVLFVADRPDVRFEHQVELARLCQMSDLIAFRTRNQSARRLRYLRKWQHCANRDRSSLLGLTELVDLLAISFYGFLFAPDAREVEVLHTLRRVLEDVPRDFDSHKLIGTEP